MDAVGERSPVIWRLPEVSNVVALGAHPDDIEIGAGGTLARIASERPEAKFTFVVATGSQGRQAEARTSAGDLLGDRVRIHMLGAQDGTLPYADPRGVKDWTRDSIPDAPDLVVAPWRGDRHQDHRFMGDLAWQLCRSTTILEYGITKWETEAFSPNLYVELDDAHARRKLDHLESHFPSQHGKSWYSREKFDADLLVHGTRAGCRRAEAFVADKLVL